MELNKLIDETEKLSLLPDRFYLVLRPMEEGIGIGFDMMAYDTTDPKNPVHAAYFVLKGIMEMMNTDLDRLVSMGQMAVMDKMVEVERKGETLRTEDLSDDITKVNLGKKH